MTNTNFNLERIYKKNEEEEVIRKDRKRDKERDKFKRNLDRKRKSFEREIED